MIFSQNVVNATDKKLNDLLSKAGMIKQQEIQDKILQLEKDKDDDVLFAVKWIYANSPLSDMANYDFEIVKNCAEHGVMLRKASPFSKDIAEDIFLNYVLHLRVNEEELCDCRSFFYSQLKDRVNALSTKDAIIEVNYWNAENLMYQSTDARTVSALTAYKSCYGRCGEESAFGVNAYRSVGIPARQIYTPRWAHCDDNHAWVEVYCDNRWCFLGACEPEEVLNKGWFTNASSRAMLIHSRCFGDIHGEEAISKVGMATFLNNLKLYAQTKKILVTVVNKNGEAVSGATVSFGILNYSNFFGGAVLTTDKNGEVQLTCGLGSINIHIKKDDKFCEQIIYTPDVDSIVLSLENQPCVLDTWQSFTFTAPKDNIVNTTKPTPEQKELCHQKTVKANNMRDARVKAMFDEAQARQVVKQYSYSDAAYDILFESRGNLANLIGFLQDRKYDSHKKEKLLLTLSQKDRRDVDTEILKECLEFSKDYDFKDEDMFYNYVVCPRVLNEPLSLNRRFILGFFTDEQKQQFIKNPMTIWEYINENINFDQSVEYGQIITKPEGALTVKNASYLSKKILFVAICRTLGIMARLNPLNQLAEYCEGEQFISIETQSKGNSTIILEKEDAETWQYYPDFSIGVLTQGEYQTLNLSQQAWDGNKMSITVTAGSYRIITDNRLPNGNIYANKYHFDLQDNQTKTIKLEKQKADLGQMLNSLTLDEFTLTSQDETKVLGSEITKKQAVLMWMEEGKEPTEHIMNEMLEQQQDFKNLPADIIFILRNKQALENAKLQLVLKTFSNIKVYYDDFALNLEPTARRVYVDPEKLPLIIVTTKPLNAVYACSGYNVGSGDMIVKIANHKF